MPETSSSLEEGVAALCSASSMMTGLGRTQDGRKEWIREQHPEGVLKSAASQTNSKKPGVVTRGFSQVGLFRGDETMQCFAVFAVPLCRSRAPNPHSRAKSVKAVVAYLVYSRAAEIPGVPLLD